MYMLSCSSAGSAYEQQCGCQTQAPASCWMTICFALCAPLVRALGACMLARPCRDRALLSRVLMRVPAPGDEQGADAWTLVYLDGVRVLKIVLQKKRVPQRDGRGSGLWPQLLDASLNGERACRAAIPTGYPTWLSLQHVRLAAQVSCAPWPC